MDSGDATFSVVHEGTYLKYFFSVRNGVLLNLGYESIDNELASAICYGLCLLLKRADYQRVQTLSSREVESFLRDENHIPAVETFPEELIKLFKDRLIGAMLYEELREETPFFEVELDSSYISKIKSLSDFFVLKINMCELFRQENIEIELIQLEKEELFVSFYSSINRVKLAPNTLGQGALESVERLVRSVIHSESINLVAE